MGYDAWTPGEAELSFGMETFRKLLDAMGPIGISANVTDAVTGAVAAVQQGIGIRIAKSDGDSFCK